MAIYINSNKKIKKIYANINGEKKNIISVWANRDGVPAKVFSNINENSYDIAPDDVLIHWTYTLNDVDNTIMLRTYNGKNQETDVVVYANYIINGKIYKTQISSNINIGYMFKDCGNIKSIKFSRNLDTSNVTDTRYMFYNCSSLSSLDLGNFDMHNVTNSYAMFHGCSNLNSLDLSNFDTGNNIYMNSMFRNCRGLSSLNLGSFNTSNVTDMGEMFFNCSNLTILDLSSFDTNKTNNMRNMFSGNSKLTTIYVSYDKWTTTNANITNMFYNCGTTSVTYK